MNKFMRKLLAGTLCATMLLGSAMTVFASDVSTLPSGDTTASTGTGQLEGYVTLDVTKVVLPTSTTTKFTLDPQGLLNKADSTKFTQGEGAVYFANVSAGAIGGFAYSDTSDELEIINKSSYDVDVSFQIGITGNKTALSQIQLVEQASLATATGPSLYLGVTTSGSALNTVAVTADAQIVTAAALKVPAVSGSSITEGYDLVATSAAVTGVKQSPNGYYYYYDLTPGYVPGEDQKIHFTLTGATNNVEGWQNVTEQIATKITYTIAKKWDGSYTMITGGAYSRSSTDNDYEVSFKGGVSQGISKIELSTSATNASPLVVPAGAYSISGTTLKINGTANTTIGTGGVGTTRYFTVTFDDGTKVTFSVSVKA